MSVFGCDGILHRWLDRFALGAGVVNEVEQRVVDAVIRDVSCYDVRVRLRNTNQKPVDVHLLEAPQTDIVREVALQPGEVTLNEVASQATRGNRLVARGEQCHRDRRRLT